MAKITIVNLTTANWCEVPEVQGPADRSAGPPAGQHGQSSSLSAAHPGGRDCLGHTSSSSIRFAVIEHS